jgi:hypothetical protein
MGKTTTRGLEELEDEKEGYVAWMKEGRVRQ